MMANRAATREASSTLDVYLRDIRDESLLSAEDERDLAGAIARGDDGARARMIRANLRLVVRIARDYAGRGLTLDDLIGEGNLGLIRATEAFDPAFGTRFSTYAGYWIKQAIRHALTNTTATIRLPAHMVNLLARWRRAERELRRELGRAPGREQIGAALGLTDAQRGLVDQALRAGRLRAEEGGEEADGAWAPEEVPARDEAPGAAMEQADQGRDLLRRLERLDDRERAIVTLRFGLEGGPPLTLKEVGLRLGVTREWVRKIELRAVQKLDDRRSPAAPAGAPRKGRGRPRTNPDGDSPRGPARRNPAPARGLWSA